MHAKTPEEAAASNSFLDLARVVAMAKRRSREIPGRDVTGKFLEETIQRNSRPSSMANWTHCVTHLATSDKRLLLLLKQKKPTATGTR